MKDYTISKLDLRPDTYLISKKDFEAFLETVKGLFYRRPHNNSAACRARFTLPCGAEVTITTTALLCTPAGNFYGRVDAWSHIRLSSWLWENVHTTGKGARSEVAYSELKEAFALFNVEFEG